MKTSIFHPYYKFGIIDFKKRYVFLSARVHPGEIPASHTMNGVLKYILNSTNEILDHFVFVIVPMINPDGVYRGHWRVDTSGWCFLVQ